jgi:secreted trypsin-like serine protease
MVYSIDRVFVHNDFTPKPIANDIALIHLVPDSRPRNPVEIKSVALHIGPNLPPETPVTSTGWGKMQSSDQFPATIFNRAIKLQTMDLNGCPRQAGMARLSKVVCARADGKKMCKGDSGSPLILTNGRVPRIVGVVSWGLSTDKNCGPSGQPGVYTEIEAFAPWICKIMGQDSDASMCQTDDAGGPAAVSCAAKGATGASLTLSVSSCCISRLRCGRISALGR